VLLDVAHRYAGLDERSFEGEAAADQERHQIISPPRSGIACLIDDFATAVDAVQRRIGSDVAVCAEQWARSVASGSSSSSSPG
jgi:hypothetical protein